MSVNRSYRSACSTAYIHVGLASKSSGLRTQDLVQSMLAEWLSNYSPTLPMSTWREYTSTNLFIEIQRNVLLICFHCGQFGPC